MYEIDKVSLFFFFFDDKIYIQTNGYAELSLGYQS